MTEDYETMEYFEKFAVWMGFEKLKTVKITDISIDDDVEDIYIPMSKEEFLKNHVEEIECWWEKSMGGVIF